MGFNKNKYMGQGWDLRLPKYQRVNWWKRKIYNTILKKIIFERNYFFNFALIFNKRIVYEALFQWSTRLHNCTSQDVDFKSSAHAHLLNTVSAHVPRTQLLIWRLYIRKCIIQCLRSDSLPLYNITNNKRIMHYENFIFHI